MKTKKQIVEAIEQCRKAKKNKKYGCPKYFSGIPENCDSLVCHFVETLKWVLDGDK